jgi:hypothetical protein
MKQSKLKHMRPKIAITRIYALFAPRNNVTNGKYCCNMVRSSLSAKLQENRFQGKFVDITPMKRT